jgi:hypothetical protein
MEVKEKIQSLKELKYVSYDDLQQNPQAEEGIG